MPSPRPHNTRVQLPWEAPSPPSPAPEIPDWTALALCAQVGGDLFFPEPGQPTAPAKKVCMGCEVRTQCLEWAITNDEWFGVWGGKSERERRKIKRARRTASTVTEVSA